MWPFKTQPIVGTLSNVAFARWLRAGSPQPLLEFLTYDEDQQETLAGIGDDYDEDRAETAAGAIADVLTAIGEGLTEGAENSTADEGDHAAQAARSVLGAQGSQIAPRSTRGPRPATMGGVTERRAQRIQDDEDAQDAPRRFCGLLPDSQRPGYQKAAGERIVLQDEIVLPESDLSDDEWEAATA